MYRISGVLQLVDQEKIHEQCLSDNPEERGKALNQLKYNFSLFSDKQQAWTDLIKLSNDKNRSVRYEALDALGFAFSQVPDKQQAWKDLNRFINNESRTMKIWAADILASVFSHIPDKQQPWDALHKLIDDKSLIVRCKTAKAYGSVFSHIPDKQQAWNDLIILTNDKHSDVRSIATESLGILFPDFPYKEYAWKDLHRLTTSSESSIRSKTAFALSYVFPQVIDKEQAWKDLHRLTNDVDRDVRKEATNALGYVFYHVPNKQQAWETLLRLTSDEDSLVSKVAVSALCSVFSHMQDKQQVWNDLVKLTSYKDNYVRYRAANTLSSIFSHVPDKQHAWEDLHTLTTSKDSIVRKEITETLSSVFFHVPNKLQLLEDLIKLTKDEDKYVRVYADHSLGKICIFKASQAEKEEDYKQELEKAIEYFERASVGQDNPSKFCLPFYRTFYSIIFLKQDSKNLIDKLLEDAKVGIEGSKNKELLLEAVENLLYALKEVQKIENIDVQDMKKVLSSYRKYCDRAEEIIRNTEETAPFASITMRKGLPILGRNLKKLLEEIQEKAKAVCKQTIGTPAESLGLETNKAAKELSEISDSSALLDNKLDENIESFKKYCGYILSGKKTQFLKMIEETKKMDFLKKLEGIKEINEYILKNAIFPRIENIHIADRIQENIKIATVQLNYTLSENFPYRIKDDNKKSIKQKIRDVLEKAKNENIDILCFPELCICEEWLPEIRKFCQKMIVIPGTYYDKENHNICRSVTDFDVEIPPQLKIVPSDFEASDIAEQRMVPGEKVLNVYDTHFGTFAVLICRDFGNFSSSLKGIVDVIFCPSFNEANNRFHSIAHNHVTDSPSYVVISNTAQYGGTAIFGRMRKSLFGALEQSNCKEKEDISYKLCEIKKGEEGMIVADFNLVYKSPPLQAPMDPKDDIRPVKNIKKILF